MGCDTCSSNKTGQPAGCNNNGSCSKGCGNMLDVYDWLSNIYYADEVVRHQYAEVRFKGTRKQFYHNPNNIPLEIGQKIVVEAGMGGHDVGEVSLVGPLVKVQMKKYRIREGSDEVKKIYRHCTERDLEKFRQAKGREYITQMKAREYAKQLKLDMKISDVEYQGDNTKATFYYTADGRVDFRELIKIFAKNFKVKIEMRQIGLRQEAGRLGGIGSCGRELCCSTWLTDFNSVPTTAARYQNLFLNPLKLSGQCGRLKCCLNYELDTYLEALEEFPKDNVSIRTAKGRARSVKTDILRRVIYFVLEDDPTGKFLPLELDDVNELLAQQKAGKDSVVEDLEEYAISIEPIEKEITISGDIVADDLDRFDKKDKRGNNRRKKNRGPRNKKKSRDQSNKPTEKRGGQNKPKPKSTSEPRSRDKKPGDQKRDQKNRPPKNRGSRNSKNEQGNKSSQGKPNRKGRGKRNDQGSKGSKPKSDD